MSDGVVRTRCTDDEKREVPAAEIRGLALGGIRLHNNKVGLQQKNTINMQIKKLKAAAFYIFILT